MLTDKQQRFIQEYLVDLNASAALLRAGYNSKNPDVDGYKLLVKPSIQFEIQKAMNERAANIGLSAEMVLKDLLDLKDKALGNKPISVTMEYDEAGNPLQRDKYIYDSKGAKGALELLGKHLKMFTDKLETDNTNTQVIITGEDKLED